MSKGGIPKFRVVIEFDDWNRYECLSCHTYFDTADGKLLECGWKFCPYCGVAWQGEFTKRNPRYPDAQMFGEGSPGKFKSNLNFIVESQNHKPYGIHFFDNLWVLESHANLWLHLEYSSAAKSIWNSYKKFIAENPNSIARLVLSNLSHTNYKVLYQYKGVAC